MWPTIRIVVSLLLFSLLLALASPACQSEPEVEEPPERAPPPRLFAHKLDQLLASLSAEQARQIQLSTDSIFWDDVPTWPDS